MATKETGDVDIWHKPDNENREKLIRVLKHLNIGDKQSLGQLEITDFTKPIVFSIWEEPEKIDFMTFIQMVSYDEANELKIMALIQEAFGWENRHDYCLFPEKAGNRIEICILYDEDDSYP